MDETLPQHPINPYGESKLIFEQILKWYDAIHGLKFVALRYFNAAGATEKYGEDHRVETHLIPNVLRVALGQRDHAEVYGTDYETPDGTCIRDYIHIVDLAQAHILALDAAQSAFYNLGTGGGNSVAEVIACCRRVTGHAIPVVEKPRRPRRSAPAGGGFGQNPQAAGLGAAIPVHRPHHRKRLGLAPETSPRLRGLTRPPRPAAE